MSLEKFFLLSSHVTSIGVYEFNIDNSFLFAYERMLQEKCVKSGEFAVMMTMGPGSTIETALLQF